MLHDLGAKGCGAHALIPQPLQMSMARTAMVMLLPAKRHPRVLARCCWPVCKDMLWHDWALRSLIAASLALLTEAFPAARLIRWMATRFPDAAIVDSQAAQRRLMDFTCSLVARHRASLSPDLERTELRKGVRPGSFIEVLVIFALGAASV